MTPSVMLVTSLDDGWEGRKILTLNDTERLLLLIFRIREFPHRGFAFHID